jgi:hypothetical protein
MQTTGSETKRGMGGGKEEKKREGRTEEVRGREEKKENENFNNSKDNQSLTGRCNNLFSHAPPQNKIPFAVNENSTLGLSFERYTKR